MKRLLVLAALWANCALAISGADLFAIPLSSGLGDNNSELYEQIAANISDAESPQDSVLETLRKRQGGQCPGGTHSCGDNTCCSIGYTCVPGFCCPNRTPRTCSSALRTCFDPSTQVCCNDGRNCPRGYDCFSGARCCPTGTIPCGSRYCYKPGTQTCCSSGGVCDNENTCCGSLCCRNTGYCSNGSCELCPAVTRTVSTTRSRTTTVYYTTVTSSAPTRTAPTFSCASVTATNDAGDTLELRSDCGLKYSPEESSSPAARALAREAEATSPPRVARAPELKLEARQNCRPWTTWTDTSTRTVTTTVISRTTRTDGFISSQGFRCPAMEVTNDAGDRLSMNTACSLTFKPTVTDRNIVDPPAETDGNIDVPGPVGGGGPVAGGDSAGSVIGPQMWATTIVVVLTAFLLL